MKTSSPSPATATFTAISKTVLTPVSITTSIVHHNYHQTTISIPSASHKLPLETTPPLLPFLTSLQPRVHNRHHYYFFNATSTVINSLPYHHWHSVPSKYTMSITTLPSVPYITTAPITTSVVHRNYHRHYHQASAAHHYHHHHTHHDTPS